MPRFLCAVGQVGLQFDGAAEMVKRPIQLPRSAVNLAEVGVIQGVCGIDRDGPADQLDRGIRMAHLVGQDTEKVECLGMIGGAGQDLAIERLGLGQAAGLMMPQGDVQRLVDGGPDRALGGRGGNGQGTLRSRRGAEGGADDLPGIFGPGSLSFRERVSTWKKLRGGTERSRRGAGRAFVANGTLSFANPISFVNPLS